MTPVPDSGPDCGHRSSDIFNNSIKAAISFSVFIANPPVVVLDWEGSGPSRSRCVARHEKVHFTRPGAIVALLKALAPVSSYSSTVPNLLYQNTGGFGEALMKSSVVKRSIVIDGHKTSVSLEDAFWSGLKEIAEAQQAPLSMVVGEIDQTRQQGNLSSAIRLFVLDHVRTHFRRD
jgi:predicted DNA-binding ribbon-helix-helix protein